MPYPKSAFTQVYSKLINEDALFIDWEATESRSVGAWSWKRENLSGERLKKTFGGEGS